MPTQRIASLLLAFLFIGGALALMALGEPESSTGKRTPRERTVRVARAETSTEGRELHFSGITRAARRADLSFKAGGRVAERRVEIGQAVKTGEVVARLETREFALGEAAARASLAEADARLAQVERDRARAERLFAERAATREELEQVSAQEDALRASRHALQVRLDNARRLLDEAVLRAPFAGIVRDVHVEAGEYVQPGQPLLELNGEGSVELEVEVPESLIDDVTPGSPALVRLPLRDDREIPAIVKHVGRSAGSAGRLFPVVISLGSAAEVPAGVTAELALSVAGESALDLPLASVINPGGQSAAVYVLDGDRVRRVPVETGRVDAGRVRVRGPLRAGTEVVIAGHSSLRDGERVEVLR